MIIPISVLVVLLLANAIPRIFGDRALTAYRAISALTLCAYVLFTFWGTISKVFAKTEAIEMGRRIAITDPSLNQVVELAQSQGLPIAGIIKGGMFQANRLQPEYLSALEAQSPRTTSNPDGRERLYVWTIDFEVKGIHSKNGVWTITQQSRRQGLNLCEVYAVTVPMHFQSKFINE
ncbi:MAG: hypothetical protein ACKVY0_18480 [Prosthecobacter sp.]|uniref:hypothetical protein n=1 Tax=Prosthecobacter sp. TaxID=1965333 RepID=UPI003900E42C